MRRTTIGQILACRSIGPTIKSSSGTSTIRTLILSIRIYNLRETAGIIVGGYLFADTRRPRIPSAEQSVATWAKLDACAGKATASRELDLDPRVPGAETQVSSYAGCSGELWRIPGGDHAAGLNRYSLRAILDFIAADRPSGP